MWVCGGVSERERESMCVTQCESESKGENECERKSNEETLTTYRSRWSHISSKSQNNSDDCVVVSLCDFQTNSSRLDHIFRCDHLPTQSSSEPTLNPQSRQSGSRHLHRQPQDINQWTKGIRYMYVASEVLPNNCMHEQDEDLSVGD